MTVKAVCLNPHSGSHWKRLSRRRRRRLVSLNYRVTFGLLNISITFSNAHLVFNFAFNFAVSMVRREPQNHADDCYFCLTNITGINASSWKKIKYPNLRSAMRPVPHSDDLPVSTPPVNKDLLSSSDEEMPSREDSAESISLEDIESTYSGTSGNKPHWITQEDLNDLAPDLYLSKQQSELLASRLKQWNLVQEDVRISSFRNRNKDLASFQHGKQVVLLHKHTWLVYVPWFAT